jgi:hypothetical protein
MKGLITVNKLIEMLLQEVTSTNFTTYQRVIIGKAQITEDIIKKRATPSQITELSNLIEQQKRIISYYIERIPRIERIINILERGKKRISKERKNEYDQLLRLLRDVVKLERKKIISTLEKQQIALQEGKPRKYLSLYRKEQQILHQLLKPIRKLDIELNDKIQLRKRPILTSKVVLVQMVVLYFYITLLVPAIPQMINKYSHVPLAECQYELGVKFEGAKNSEQVLEVVKRYWDDDLKHQLAAEEEFEVAARTRVFGEYSIQDLELTKELFQKTYGLNNLQQHAKIDAIIYLPKNAELRYINPTEKACASKTFAGVANVGGINSMTLTSSQNMSKKGYFSVVAHEYAHVIHRETLFRYPNFNKEWERIQGGYARIYGTNNTWEDVATIVEAAVDAYLHDRNVYSIRPMDGNNVAFQAKLRLLKQYNFLPPALEVR